MRKKRSRLEAAGVKMSIREGETPAVDGKRERERGRAVTGGHVSAGLWTTLSSEFFMMGVCLMGSPFPALSLPPHPYSISIMMAVQGALRKGTDLFWHVRHGYSTGKWVNIKNCRLMGVTRTLMYRN